MFINFSNHPSERWNSDEMNAALKFGEVKDIPFPKVASSATKKDVAELASFYVSKILEQSPSCVLCQGEFCLCYEVIRLLKEKNILVVAACSDRNVTETVQKDGSTAKTLIFRFVQFREY